jgi:hypothetical protein
VVNAGTRSEADVAAIARATRETGLLWTRLRCNDLGGTAGTRDQNAIPRAAEQHLALA